MKKLEDMKLENYQDKPCEYCESSNCEYCNEDECPCCGSKEYFIPTRFNLQFKINSYKGSDYDINYTKWEENLQEFLDTEEVRLFAGQTCYELEMCTSSKYHEIHSYNKKFAQFLSKYPECTHVDFFYSRD